MVRNRDLIRRGGGTYICRGDLAALQGLHLGRGELWTLAAVPVWSSYSVLLKRRPPALPERSTLAASTAFGLLWMTPLVLLSPGSLDVAWTPKIAGGVAYIGAGASVVAFLCWNRGVALVGPARAGVFINLMPLSGALLAFLILGEALRPYHAVGAALVFAGILFTQVGARPKRRGIGRRAPGSSLRLRLSPGESRWI